MIDTIFPVDLAKFDSSCRRPVLGENLHPSFHGDTVACRQYGMVAFPSPQEKTRVRYDQPYLGVYHLSSSEKPICVYGTDPLASLAGTRGILVSSFPILLTLCCRSPRFWFLPTRRRRSKLKDDLHP